VTYRERQRLADIQAAIDATRSHLQRGDLSDVFGQAAASTRWRVKLFKILHPEEPEHAELCAALSAGTTVRSA
jgi:hypothetical protein